MNNFNQILRTSIILLSAGLCLTGCIGNFKVDPNPGGTNEQCIKDGCIYITDNLESLE